MRLVVALLLALGVMVQPTAATASDRPITLNLGHGLAAEHAVGRAMDRFAARVSDRTAGMLRITVHPAERLGPARVMVDMLQDGQLDLLQASAAAFEPVVTEFAVFGVPYLFRDRQRFFAVLDGEIGRGLMEAAARRNMVGLAYFDSGARSFYTTRPVRRVEDLAGLRIRIQASPVTARFIQLLGATPVPLSWGETLPAFAAGRIDGAENNPTALTQGGHGRFARYLVLDEHTMVPDVLMANAHVWSLLSEDHQHVVRTVAAEVAAEHRIAWQAELDAAIEDARRSGVEIVEPDRSGFAARTAPLVREFQRRADLAVWIGRIGVAD